MRAKEIEQGVYALDVRGQLLVSQALNIAVKHMRALEDRAEPYPVDGEHAEPSNRSDMEYLLENFFPMALVIEQALEDGRLNSGVAGEDEISVRVTTL